MRSLTRQWRSRALWKWRDCTASPPECRVRILPGSHALASHSRRGILALRCDYIATVRLIPLNVILFQILITAKNISRIQDHVMVSDRKG